MMTFTVGQPQEDNINPIALFPGVEQWGVAEWGILLVGGYLLFSGYFTAKRGVSTVTGTYHRYKYRSRQRHKLEDELYG